MNNFAFFIPAVAIGSAGAIVFAVLAHSMSGDQFARAIGAELRDNGVRSIAGAYLLIAIWIGVRLSQTVRNPERWDDFAEMGWVFLIATGIGSTIFVRKSALSKWMFGLSIIGLAAMAYVALSA